MDNKLHIVAKIYCIVGVVFSIMGIMMNLRFIEKSLVFMILAIIGGIQTLAYIAILLRKKLGFYLLLATGVAAFIINTILGLDILIAVASPVFGILLLFGILQIGGKNKSWDVLR